VPGIGGSCPALAPTVPAVDDGDGCVSAYGGGPATAVATVGRAACGGGRWGWSLDAVMRSSLRPVVGELTFSQEVWLAIIGATAVLLGVVAGLGIGIWQASKAWERQRVATTTEHDHQVQLERDRFMRGERIAAYRRLTQSCADMLLHSALRVLPIGEEDKLKGGTADAAWTAALAETQLVGARAVVEIAQSIEKVRKDRSLEWVMERYYHERAMKRYDGVERGPDEPGHTSEGVEDEVEDSNAMIRRWSHLSQEQQTNRLDLLGRLTVENDQRIAALVAACRDDIASLRL